MRQLNLFSRQIYLMKDKRTLETDHSMRFKTCTGEEINTINSQI